MEQTRTRAERRAHWRMIVEGWDAGAESAVAFCQRKKIGMTSLYRWRKRLREEGAQRSRFLPVKVVETQAVAEVPYTPARGAGVEIALRGDRRIRVEAGFDEDVLRRAVSVLESC